MALFSLIIIHLINIIEQNGILRITQRHIQNPVKHVRGSFCKNRQRLKPLTIFAKRSILDVWNSSQYNSVAVDCAKDGFIMDILNRNNTKYIIKNLIVYKIRNSQIDIMPRMWKQRHIESFGILNKINSSVYYYCCDCCIIMRISKKKYF